MGKDTRPSGTCLLHGRSKPTLEGSEFEGLPIHRHTQGRCPQGPCRRRSWSPYTGALQDEVGTQPFAPGPLFASKPISYLLRPEDTDPIALNIDGLQLDFASFTTEPMDSIATSGVLATLQLLAVKPTEQALFLIDDNPIRETRLVLGDRVSEVRFRSVGWMGVKVVGTATAVTPSTWGDVKIRVD